MTAKEEELHITLAASKRKEEELQSILTAKEELQTSLTASMARLQNLLVRQLICNVQRCNN